MLIEQLGGRSVDELLAIDAEAYLTEFPIEDELEEFLSLKHLFAVQTALEVLTGKTPGGKDDPCAAAEIAFEDGDTIIDARISIDLVTEKIEACGKLPRLRHKEEVQSRLQLGPDRCPCFFGGGPFFAKIWENQTGNSL